MKRNFESADPLRRGPRRVVRPPVRPSHDSRSSSSSSSTGASGAPGPAAAAGSAGHVGPVPRPGSGAPPSSLPGLPAMPGSSTGPVNITVPGAVPAQNHNLGQPIAGSSAGTPTSSASRTLPVSGVANRTPVEEPDSGDYREFSLLCCNEEDLEGIRYHMLKFLVPSNLRKNRPEAVDPASQFVPPIRMHRKDPKLLQVMAGVPLSPSPPQEGDVEMPDDPISGAVSSFGNGPSANGSGTAKGTPGTNSTGGAGPDGANDDTGAQGSTELGNPPEKKKKNRFFRRRKTHQVQGGEKHEAARKLRYEEYYPWVMEDFEGKNVWVSSYDAAQSDQYAVLVSDDNGFKLIPLEKSYRMTQNARYATLSLEDAEERMQSRNSNRDRWLMSHLQPRQIEKPIHEAGGGLRTVVGAEEKPKYQLDEEFDYNDDEMFQDDEGAPILDGPDEDLKEAEDRIKREHRQANQLMGEEDADLDDLFGDEEDKSASVDKQGKKLRKYLRSLEKNQFYDSDDEENPYASEDASDSDSNDEVSAAATVKSEVDGDGANLRDDLLPLALSSFRKKTIKNLPPGMAVLQLPTSVLSKFPAGVWNPGLKPRSPLPATAPASPCSDDLSIPKGVDPAMILTEDDIRNNIDSGKTVLKELVSHLREKLRVYPDINKPRLRTILKRVARSKEGKLYLN